MSAPPQRRRGRLTRRLIAPTTAAVVLLGVASQPVLADQAGKRPNDTFISSKLNDRATIGVNVLTGNLLIQQQDISIKGVGQDFSLVRSYNSSRAGTEGNLWGFGFGWTTNTATDVKLYRFSSSATFYRGDGSSYSFAATGGGDYTTPNGIDADLHTNADGTSVLTYRGSQKKWTFAADGDLQSSTDRNGNKITYDVDGSPLKTRDTQGRVVQPTTATDETLVLGDGNSRQWRYRLAADLEVQEPDAAKPDRLVSYTDPAGGEYTYDTHPVSHLVNRITTPGGRGADVTYGFGYGGWNHTRVTKLRLLTNLATGAGRDFTFAYNQTDTRCANGSLTTGVTKVTDARGATTSYCRNITGDDSAVVDVIDPLGRHQATSYNTQGRITAQGTGSALTTMSYNGNGTLSNSLAPAGEKTTYAYSGSGAAQYQPSSVSSPDNHSQFFGYDGKGNLESVKDASPGTPNLQSTLTYNPDGTIATAKDGENRTTTYGYYGIADGVKRGYLRSSTPPLVLATMTQPGATTLDYDALGHVTSATDGRGKVTTYAYDALDRTKKITFDGGSSLTYTYDADGNQTERVDSAGGSYTYTYDKLGQRTHEGLPGSRAVDYTYDEVGNLRTLTDGSGTTLYGYDLAGQPCFVAPTTSATGTCASPPANGTTFTYDNVGNRTGTTYPNGVAVTGTFDASRKAKTISVKNGSTVLDDRTYTYKTYATGQSSSGELLASMTAPHDGGAYTYDYNSSGLLSRATAPYWRPSGGTEQTEYTYDKAGNRTLAYSTVTDTEDDAEQTFRRYSYNAANQLCALAPSCGSPGAGSTVFSYDTAGNDLRFGYNDRNQTTSGGGSLAYAGPNQFEVTEDAGATVENNLLGVGRKLTSSGTTSFTRDSDGQLLYRTLPNGTKQYYVLDALGSVIAITDGAGTRTAAYKYDPDGNATSSAAIAGFGFTGAYLRTGTKPLYHNGLRWYDPSIGRWTQPDSLDQPGDLHNANRYVYAGSNPVNFVDPSGQLGEGYCPPSLSAAGCRAYKAKRRSVGNPTTRTGLPKPPKAVCGAAALAGVATLAKSNLASGAVLAGTGVLCEFGDE